MRVCTFSDLRSNLRERLDEVHANREPILITSSNGVESVILDKAEYDRLMKTLHVLRSPANAERLLRAIGEAEAGRVTEREPVEGSEDG